jgi:hypothetical protein
MTKIARNEKPIDGNPTNATEQVDDWAEAEAVLAAAQRMRPKCPNELSRSRKPDNLDLEPISAAGRLEIRNGISRQIEAGNLKLSASTTAPDRTPGAAAGLGDRHPAVGSAASPLRCVGVLDAGERGRPLRRPTSAAAILASWPPYLNALPFRSARLS